MESTNTNKMGKWSATSYIIGNMIGSGIFTTPNYILQNVSSIGLSLVVWSVCGIVAMLGAICYIELGTAIRRSGADFAYISYVKWKSVAFTFMICTCLLNYPATLAFQSQTFSEYVLRGLQIKFCSPLVEYIAPRLIAFLTLWILMFINFFSVRYFVAKFQIVATIAKIFASLSIIAIGAYTFFITDFETKNIVNIFEGSKFDKLTDAFVVGLYSYDGWDILNYGIEEIENPSTTMLFSILIGMSVVILIFLAMNISFFIVLTVPEINATNAIATVFAQKTIPNFHYLISFLVSIVLIGSLNSSLFSVSRLMFAGARNRQFPSFLSCLNYKHDSPRAAILFPIIVSSGFLCVSEISNLLDYVGFTQWLQRFVTLFVLFYLRFYDVPVHPEATRIPILFGIIFFTGITVLVVSIISKEIENALFKIVFVVLGASVIIYYLILSENALLTHDENEQLTMDVFKERMEKQLKIK